MFYPYFIVNRVSADANVLVKYVFVKVTESLFSQLTSAIDIYKKDGALPTYILKILGAGIHKKLGVSQILKFTDLIISDSESLDDSDILLLSEDLLDRAFRLFKLKLGRVLVLVLLIKDIGSSIQFINLPILKFDTILTLKLKICYASGIIPHKQHLFANVNNKIWPLYYYVTDLIKQIAVNAYSTDPVDGKINVFNNDYLRLDNLMPIDVYLLAFDDKYNSVGQSSNLKKHLYTSSVRVLYPMISNDMYLLNDFPDVEYKLKYLTLKLVLTDPTKLADYRITKMHKYMLTRLSPFDIRNVIDSFATTLTVPYISTCLLQNGKRVTIRKSHISFQVISLIVPLDNIRMKIRMKEHSKYFININIDKRGYVTAGGDWGILAGFTMLYIDNIILTVVRPVISKLTGHDGSFTTQSFDVKYNYNSSDIDLYNISQVIDITLSKLVLCGILLNLITTTRDTSETYIFKRGMCAYNTNQFINVNGYNIYSNTSVAKLWALKVLSQKTMSIRSDGGIKISISGLASTQLLLTASIISRNIVNLINTNSNIQIIKKVQRDSKKLKHIDPYLYQPNKYFSDNSVVYSKICQKPYQPEVVSEILLNLRADFVKKNAIKFINYTTEKPIIYTCPNKKFPYINFIVGLHPRGYCIPCCKKTDITKSKNLDRLAIYNKCMLNHIYNLVADTKFATYLNVYGKSILPGRYSKLPSETLYKLFPDLFLRGVAQDTLGPYYRLLSEIIGISHLSILELSKEHQNLSSLPIMIENDINIDLHMRYMIIGVYGYGIVTFKLFDKLQINLIGNPSDIRLKNIIVLQKKSGEVYPLSTKDTSIFNYNSKLINIILNIFNDVLQNKVLIKSKITLKGLASKYKILKQFVNKGLCYAVNIKVDGHLVYIPILLAVPLPSYSILFNFPTKFASKEITLSLYNLILNVKGKDKYQYLVHKGKCYGILNGGISVYFSPTAVRSLDKLNIILIGVNPHLMNVGKFSPVNTKMLYYRYIYKTLVWKINLIIYQQRNPSIRSKIKAALKARSKLTFLDLIDRNRISGVDNLDLVVLNADFLHLRTNITEFAEWLLSVKDKVVLFTKLIRYVLVIGDMISKDKLIYITKLNWELAKPILSLHFINKWDWVTDPKISSLNMNFYTFKRYPDLTVTLSSN